MLNNKLILFCIVNSMAFGAFVPNEIAMNVAQNIYIENEHLHSGDDFSVSNVEKIKEGENTLIYIFHLDPNGFIMVPADDQAMPNLAFGFEHSFESINMPLNLDAIINQYKKEIKEMVFNQNTPRSQIKTLWNNYLDGEIRIDHSRDVSPLIDAEFDQGGSWNNGIQDAIGFNGPVGCVSVAMCQIMHYWGYPEHGTGSTYYTENDYGYIEEIGRAHV